MTPHDRLAQGCVPRWYKAVQAIAGIAAVLKSTGMAMQLEVFSLLISPCSGS